MLDSTLILDSKKVRPVFTTSGLIDQKLYSRDDIEISLEYDSHRMQFKNGRMTMFKLPIWGLSQSNRSTINNPLLEYKDIVRTLNLGLKNSGLTNWIDGKTQSKQLVDLEEAVGILTRRGVETFTTPGAILKKLEYIPEEKRLKRRKRDKLDDLISTLIQTQENVVTDEEYAAQILLDKTLRRKQEEHNIEEIKHITEFLESSTVIRGLLQQNVGLYANMILNRLITPETIPKRCWDEVRDVIKDMVEKYEPETMVDKLEAAACEVLSGEISIEQLPPQISGYVETIMGKILEDDFSLLLLEGDLEAIRKKTQTMQETSRFTSNLPLLMTLFYMDSYKDAKSITHYGLELYKSDYTKNKQELVEIEDFYAQRVGHSDIQINFALTTEDSSHSSSVSSGDSCSENMEFGFDNMEPINFEGFATVEMDSDDELLPMILPEEELREEIQDIAIHQFVDVVPIDIPGFLLTQSDRGYALSKLDAQKSLLEEYLKTHLFPVEELRRLTPSEIFTLLVKVKSLLLENEELTEIGSFVCCEIVERIIYTIDYGAPLKIAEDTFLCYAQGYIAPFHCIYMLERIEPLLKVLMDEKQVAFTRVKFGTGTTMQFESFSRYIAFTDKPIMESYLYTLIHPDEAEFLNSIVKDMAVYVNSPSFKLIDKCYKAIFKGKLENVRKLSALASRWLR
jgi:hypothetical protein